MTGASLSAEWRQIPLSPYRRYEVSSDGRVRRGQRELTGDLDAQGYRRVLLSYVGLPRRFKVHRLVCEAFHGPCPEGHECGHLDGNPANNAAHNLAWMTRSENNKHAVAHGTHAGLANLSPGVGAGENHPHAKLSEDDVRAIRAAAKAGQSERTIARAHGISPSQTHKIISKEMWAHVE